MANNIGLRVLIGLPLSVLFIVIRIMEGHFGIWTSIFMMLALAGPTVIVAIAEKRKRRQK